jgi:hypothetical protein
MAMVGLAWQLGIIAFVMIALLFVAYRYLHSIRLPVTWPWVLGYAAAIALVCEAIHLASREINESVPMHIEVLLPAFVLGCMLRRPQDDHPHAQQAIDLHQHADPGEQRAATWVSAIFMVLVGLNMPVIFGGTAKPPSPEDAKTAMMTVSASQPAMSWGVMALHVLALTVLSNLGKMFPAFCYRREAHWRERMAVSIGMWPRGEVGAGVLVISLAYGIGGPIVTAAMLSLSLNLLLTGVFIVMVKKLLAGVPSVQEVTVEPEHRPVAATDR